MKFLYKLWRYAACAWMLAGAMLAQAQGFPNKPVRIVIGFPPGGGIDIVARLMAPKLTELLGQPVVIDNKPGANGVLGMDHVAKAPADGHTLFLGTLGNFSVNPALYPNLPFSVEKQFAPLTELASVSFVLFVNPALPVKSVAELVAYAKSQPGQLNFSSSSSGGLPHLAGELFKLQTKTFITHIPYRGAGPALQDLIAGNVDMMFDGLGSSAQHIKGGRIKALMVSGNKRNAAFPDVPCAAELGFPDYTVTTWYGLWAPKGTPADVQARVVEEVKKASTGEDLKAAWALNGADFPHLSGAQFGGFVNGEIKRWAAVVKASGAKLD